MNIRQIHQKLLLNAIRFGDSERVRETISRGLDPNGVDRRGRPLLIAAVRARIVESGVVEALLEAGADPRATDEEGFTALERAEARLEKLTQKREQDPVRRSPSLDPYGNLVLSDEEREWLAEVRRDSPDIAADLEADYLQERRKVAVRQFMPRRELLIIIGRLRDLN